MDIKNKLLVLAQSSITVNPYYWLTYILGGLLLLVVALFYQYQLEELPCVVCIQVRLLISLWVIIAIVGLMLREHPSLNLLLQFCLLAVFVGFVERSYLLLGTEKGFIFGSCGFDIGLPEWFAIDVWLPWLYQVEASCGYTPEIIWGITMAEALMVFSVCLVITSIFVILSGLVRMIKKA